MKEVLLHVVSIRIWMLRRCHNESLWAALKAIVRLTFSVNVRFFLFFYCCCCSSFCCVWKFLEKLVLLFASNKSHHVISRIKQVDDKSIMLIRHVIFVVELTEITREWPQIRMWLRCSAIHISEWSRNPRLNNLIAKLLLCHQINCSNGK